MARKRTATQPKPADFATFQQLIAAHRDMQAAKSKTDVADVFKQHHMSIGWKRLGKLLLGAKPDDLVFNGVRE